MDEKFSSNGCSEPSSSSRRISGELLGVDFLCHHFGRLNDMLCWLLGSGFGSDRLISAGGGDTAWKGRFTSGYRVGRSITDGLLLGTPLILFIELPDSFDVVDNFEFADMFREWELSRPIDLTVEAEPCIDGLEIGGIPFRNAKSLADEADVCCDIERGDFAGS